MNRFFFDNWCITRFDKLTMTGCWARIFTVLMVYTLYFGHAEIIENPAIAQKCTKMAQKRVNGVWQTTHFPSYCSWRVKNSDSDKEAAKLCEKVSLSKLTIHSNVENDKKSNVSEHNSKMYFSKILFVITLGFSITIRNGSASKWSRDNSRSLVQRKSQRLEWALHG